MSGAERRAEEQGYYQTAEVTAVPRRQDEPEVPMAVVCAEAQHALSATTGMKSCVCGVRKTTQPATPESLF